LVIPIYFLPDKTPRMIYKVTSMSRPIYLAVPTGVEPVF
jgi:hypothetical protein